MEKFKLRYENLGSAVSIDLENGYTIIAFISKFDEITYNADIFIKNTYSDVFISTTGKTISITSNSRKFSDIKKLITKKISSLIENGHLDREMNYYDYLTNAFHMGINEIGGN